ELGDTALTTATEAEALRMPRRGLRQLVACGPFLRALRKAAPAETWQALESWADEKGGTLDQAASRPRRLLRDLPPAAREKLATLRYEDRCRVVRAELPAALGQLQGERFDLVFADPPYARRAAQAALDALTASGALAPGARIVLETDRREPSPVPPPGLRLA